MMGILRIGNKMLSWGGNLLSMPVIVVNTGEFSDDEFDGDEFNT